MSGFFTGESSSDLQRRKLRNKLETRNDFLGPDVAKEESAKIKTGFAKLNEDGEDDAGTFSDLQVRMAGAKLLEARKREREEARISRLNLLAQQQQEATRISRAEELVAERRNTVRQTRRWFGGSAFALFILASICLLLVSQTSHIGRFLFGEHGEPYRILLYFLFMIVVAGVIWTITAFRVPRFLRVWIGHIFGFIFPACVRGFLMHCVRHIIPARVRQIIPADWRLFLPEWIRMYAQIFFVVFSLLGCAEVTDIASIPPAIFLSLHTIPMCLLLGVPDDFCFFDCFIGFAASGILGHHGKTLRGWIWVTTYVAVLYHVKLILMMILHGTGVLADLDVDSGDAYAY